MKERTAMTRPRLTARDRRPLLGAIAAGGRGGPAATRCAGGLRETNARTLSSSYGEAVDLFARGEAVTSVIGWDAMVGFAADKDKVLADPLTQGVITTAAAALVSDKNKAIYQYDNLSALLSRAKFNPSWPLEAEGDFVPHDTVQEEYQRFLTARPAAPSSSSRMTNPRPLRWPTA
jgi:hypothetical protein